MKITAIQSPVYGGIKRQNIPNQARFENKNEMQKALFADRNYGLSFGTRGKVYTKTDPAIKSIETVKSRGGKVPERVEKLAEEYAKDETLKNLTLAEIHKIAYGDLKKCKTLDEAKKLFPEFEGVKPAEDVYAKEGSVLYGIQQGHVAVEPCDTDDVSLKFLQHYWADLHSIARLSKFMRNVQGCYAIWEPASAFKSLEIPSVNYEYAQAAKFEKGHHRNG